MILRPRQKLFVERSVAALREHGNTLGVAPTGAGKTVMLSAAAGAMLAPGDRALVLQHRDELVDQNRRTFHALNPRIATGTIDARSKDFHRDVAFAMVQTLSSERNLQAMRPVAGLVIDEAHHAAAGSYRKVIDRARELNPALWLLGVTATPNRGDKKALRGVFDNVSDQITLGELLAAGNLVRPRTFVIDVGAREALSHVRKTITDFDMSEVEKIMDKVVINEAVVEKWKEIAGGRPTVVFCSTVEHAAHVAQAFRDSGVGAAMVSGDMSAGERERTLTAFDRREFPVLTNVAVLTEGWDCPPTSCVILLRPSSFKSTMIQMVGRGLRTVDPERYPGVVKTDCIVLDFGTSTLTHGSLEQDVDLDGGKKGEAPKKVCPDCESKVPLAATECPICGHEFPKIDAGGGGEPDKLDKFAMTEVDLFEASPFRWEDLWGDGAVMMASSFEAWAVVIFFNGTWHAIGGAEGRGVTHLAVGDRLVTLAMADDYMRLHGDTDAAAKSRRWLHMPATEKQLQHLQLTPATAGDMTRYRAACFLTWKFQQRGIKAKLMTLGRVAA